MAWKREREKKEEAPSKRGPPTWEIREAKDERPFAFISGRVVKGRGRGGASVMLFPAKFEGSFAALMLSPWGRGAAIPIQEAKQVDVLDDGTLVVEFPFFAVSVKGENSKELIEFLNYIPELPKEAGFKKGPEEEAPEKPKKRAWKR